MNVSFSALIAFVGLLLTASSGFSQTTIYIVRHAEKQRGHDRGLTERGVKQAHALATALEGLDIRAIYVSELIRTRETADPLAKARGITPKIVNQGNSKFFANTLKRSVSDVLVVGHSETIPRLVRDLGCEPAIKIGQKDYGDLFIVTLGQPPTLKRKKYF